MPARGFGLLLEHPPIQQADADGWTQFLVAVPLTHLSSIILAVVVRSEFLPHSSAALARGFRPLAATRFSLARIHAFQRKRHPGTAAINQAAIHARLALRYPWSLSLILTQPSTQNDSSLLLEDQRIAWPVSRSSSLANWPNLSPLRNPNRQQVATANSINDLPPHQSAMTPYLAVSCILHLAAELRIYLARGAARRA